MTRILTFSTLYPNAEMPSHGVFVENRLRQLVGAGRVEARVVAPVAWFPSGDPRFGRFAKLARVPRRETRNGLDVLHPRYAMVPGVGMYVSPLAIALAARRAILDLQAEGFDFDVIDAHYFYPDGVAAALLAKWFDRPFTVTARGSDVTKLGTYRLPRRMIRWAARASAGIVTVCDSLRRELTAIDVDASRALVLRNGVDLKSFQPIDPRAARAELGLPVDATIIASVGHLISRKGHEFVIGALPSLPDVTLLIAGSGPEEEALRALAERLGVADRVVFTGQLAPGRVSLVYSAANVLVLASSNEGWANVLLEAMACGTPVVATDVGGTSEVVRAPEAGVIVRSRDAATIATAVAAMLAAPPDRAATRRYAERFSWDETTSGQEQLFASLVRRIPDASPREEQHNEGSRPGATPGPARTRAKPESVTESSHA
jgi:glycosyltransferase involved in cell wall biosynthesis